MIGFYIIIMKLKPIRFHENGVWAPNQFGKDLEIPYSDYTGITKTQFAGIYYQEFQTKKAGLFCPIIAIGNPELEERLKFLRKKIKDA